MITVFFHQIIHYVLTLIIPFIQHHSGTAFDHLLTGPITICKTFDHFDLRYESFEIWTDGETRQLRLGFCQAYDVCPNVCAI